jgi:hypothetical protein
MINNLDKYLNNEVLSYRLNSFYTDIIAKKYNLIKNVIDILKMPIVKIKHKINILNPDETIAYEIPSQDIVYGSISYSENLQNGVRRTISFTLINTSGQYTPMVNSNKGYYSKNYTDGTKTFIKNSSFTKTPLWACTKFSYDIGIAVSEENYVWFNKGIFILDKANIIQEDSKKEVQIQAKDKFSLFEGRLGKLITALEIPVGTVFGNVVCDLLNTSVGNGYAFDCKIPLFSQDIKNLKTQASIKKEAGDNMSSIFEELSVQASCAYYYNEQGYLVFDKISEIMLDSHKPTCWIYEEKNKDLLDLSEDFDYDNAINIIKVVSNNTDSKIYQALAVNNDARSPFNVGKIGNRLGDIITDANVWSDELAMELARYHLRKNNITCLTTSIKSKINPLIKLDQLIKVDHSFLGLHHENFVVTGISFSDNSHEMNLTVANTSNLFFDRVGDEGYVY